MASNIFEACKKMRRANPKLPFQFENFPVMGSTENLNYGPFREIIRLFLREFAEKFEKDLVPGMASWSILIIKEQNGTVFPLYILEETVDQSVDPFCDHCKFSGWGHHFVCKRKYHLIIPEIDQWKKPLNENFFDIRSHILYGLIHCNGYGHLICINGVGQDSKFLSKTDTMNLWDRICSKLCTRKVSVRDEMDMGFLYVVAYGQSWYGKWGYKFSHGSFGARKEKYESAVEYLRSLGLDKVTSDFKNRSKGKRIKQIINKYRGMGDIPLFTISDLLKFMLGYGVQGQVQSKTEEKMVKSGRQHVSKRRENEIPISFDALVTSIAKSSRWPARRVEFVVKEIVNFLKEEKDNSNEDYAVSRYEMREQLRKCIGDTGLIDFVLKSINCFAMGNYIFQRSINSSTRRFEFRIQEVLEEAKPTSRWPDERVEYASEVTTNILTENSGKEYTMPQQELQDKASEYIGEPQMIDSVVNSIDNPTITNKNIFRPRNPSTKRVEFTTQAFVQDKNNTMEWNAAKDALYLYRSLLSGYTETHPVSLAIGYIMDSKNFVKEWHFEEHDVLPLMPLSCQFLPSFDELETELTRPLSPDVVVVVPRSSTIGELKIVVQSAFRDTYCIMDNLVVSQIGGLKRIEENKVVCHSIESSDPVWVRGFGLDLGTLLRYEDGTQKLTVDCCCGTKYDDGERLAVCEGCDVSQHTRCCNIADNEDAPPDFLCLNCKAALFKKQD